IRRGNTPEDVELSAEGLAPNFIRPWRRPPAHSDRCRIPLADDLHLSQRRRKGFVGGIDRGPKLGDSPSLVTVRPHGGGRFYLTCSFRTLGFRRRTAPACQVTTRMLARPARAAQVLAAEQEEAGRWPTNPA